MTSEEREQFILDNINLVHYIVNKFRIHPNSYYTKEDLIQEGMASLCYAVDHFDESKGYAFSTYAVPTIQGNLLRFMRNNMGEFTYPRSIQDTVMKVFTGNIDEDSAPLAKDILNSFNPIRLDGLISTDEDSDEFSAIIGEDSNVEEHMNLLELEETIHNVLSNFKDKEIDIVYEYYYTRMLGYDDANQQEIARKYNLSQCHVSRILAKFKRYLSKELGVIC